MDLLRAALPLVAFLVTYTSLTGEPPPFWGQLAAGFCHGCLLGYQSTRDRRSMGARRR